LDKQLIKRLFKNLCISFLYNQQKENEYKLVLILYKLFVSVKKSHIGCEMVWTWVYKLEAIFTLQDGFVGVELGPTPNFKIISEPFQNPLSHLLSSHPPFISTHQAQ
jgi:hypothetical protein